jgi:hypothetical protein
MSENINNIHSQSTTTAAVFVDDGLQRLPAHLCELPDKEWAVWRSVALRGAGFPAGWVLNLAAKDCARAVNDLFEAEAELLRAREAAIDVLQQHFHRTEVSDRVHLINAMRSIRKGKLPKAYPFVDEIETSLVALRDAHARQTAALESFEQRYELSVAQTSQAIREAINDDRFREAIIWQNRHAFHNGIEPLSRRSSDSSARTAKQRQQESLVASYLQRYCVKNDTIGFFGPVAWANIVSHDESLRVEPGAEMLEVRNVRFEGWCIDALAETLSQDKRLRPWLAPRRVPFVHLEGSMLHLTGGKALKIGEREAAILRGCDGERVAKAVAEEMVEQGVVGSTGEVYRILEVLNSRGLITWTLDVALSLHPERSLRRQLERVEDERLRTPALQMLNELESARAAVAQAAGDAAQLDEAIGNLEATFSRLTGVDSTRAGGRTYAARTLVYEDCRRDIKLDIGTDVMESLGAPLSLLLHSARWFTHTTATIYRQAFKKIYDELALKSGSRVVDAVTFWQRANPLLHDKDNSFVAPLIKIFKERWANILKIPAGARQVQYSSAELRAGVLAAFKAPRPGWRAACYHSPDVMIAAKSVEAINRGDYHLVMGELHLSLNTMNASLRVSQSPRPDDLIRALDLDLPEPRLVPVNPKNWAGATARTLPALISSKDFRLVLTPEPHEVPASQAVPLGSLVVEETGGALVLRTRDGRISFDIIEAFGTALSSVIGNYFHILAAESHTPRVTIDRVTVCRETWRFSPSDLSFAFEKDESARFLAARRFAHMHDLPRFVFVKVPVEVKPFYVDFDSPIYVDILAKMIRRTKEKGRADALVSVTEMHPRADETWLPDGEGEHYTSELRIIAVDLQK